MKKFLTNTIISAVVSTTVIVAAITIGATMFLKIIGVSIAASAIIHGVIWAITSLWESR